MEMEVLQNVTLISHSFCHHWSIGPLLFYLSNRATIPIRIGVRIRECVNCANDRHIIVGPFFLVLGLQD